MPAEIPPELASLRAKIAAEERWGREPDRNAATAPARKAFNDKFEREADPDGTLDAAERTKRAEHLRRAHMYRLALRSAKARAARKAS